MSIVRFVLPVNSKVCPVIVPYHILIMEYIHSLQLGRFRFYIPGRRRRATTSPLICRVRIYWQTRRMFHFWSTSIMVVEHEIHYLKRYFIEQFYSTTSSIHYYVNSYYANKTFGTIIIQIILADIDYPIYAHWFTRSHRHLSYLSFRRFDHEHIWRRNKTENIIKNTTLSEQFHNSTEKM